MLEKESQKAPGRATSRGRGLGRILSRKEGAIANRKEEERWTLKN